MNKNNLVQNKARTPTERRESARKAGIASGKARKERKSLREALELLLSTKVESPEQPQQKIMGAEYLAYSIFQKAGAGDVRAFKIIAEIMGEYKQTIEIEKPAEERQLSPKEAAEFIRELERTL